ncbi:MAG: isoprenylcysteine carboxyl methyltransferase [Micromonosporaceae bacterium]|nr:isoprenylcysteine carboxyl methyltransferase [Micromonosporaceae bacterium]
MGTILWFVLVVGLFSVLIPWWLTGWRLRDLGPWWLPVRVFGVLLIVVGGAAILHAFARFAVEGLGTPSPVAPPERLVVGGLYRHVRNPMYVATSAVLIGQALLFGQMILLWYAAAFALVTVSFVRYYEEPTLRRRFGADYEAYRRAVPGWWPRLRPWRP